MKSLIFLTATSLFACTGLKLTSTDGSTVNGRTVEFGVQIEASIAVIPRNYEFTANTPLGEGLKYTSKYAAIGLMAFDNPLIMDGINEKGLSVGSFYFPGFAGYSDISYRNKENALSPVDFSNWLLTQFASLEEIKMALSKVIIAPTVEKAWGKTPPPFHYVVYDKRGNSIVIEPIQGTLKVHENPLGIITNSPTFDWHMLNLRNFIHLSPENADPITLNGVKFSAFGQGSGLTGIPGDFTPPSRFVRAAIFSANAVSPKNAVRGVMETFHLLNQFDLPIGSVRGQGEMDTTQFTSVKNPDALQYYFKTYDNQNIFFLSLERFNLSAKKIKKISTNIEAKVTEITD